MKKKTKVSLAVAVILCVILLGLCFWLGIDVARGSMKEDSVSITIDQGDGTRTVAETLAQEGVISHPRLFRLFAKIEEVDGQWQRGTFTVECGQGYHDLFRQLTTPQTASIKVTIPEGKQAKEVAAIFEKAGVCSAQDFLNASTYGAYDYDFLKNVSYRDRISGLEGYLFPDTYFFEADTAAETVVNAMLQRFQEVVATEENMARAEAMGRSFDEIVILGSMVESEATTAEDRKLVAGVFWNRLNHPELFPRLQSCVTVEYAMGIKKQVLSLEDTKFDSPYNTYQNEGLPYGPICCPSLESMEAALWPTENNYYYFQSDDQGKLHFAETFEEHAAIQKQLHANWGA